jgi:hypothetical protein
MWAKELAELQDRYPDVSNTVIFAEGFKGFTGATGVGLPYKDEQIVNIAARLLRSKGDDNYVRLKYIDTTPAEYDKYKLASHKIRSNEPKPQEVKKVEKPRLNKGLF